MSTISWKITGQRCFFIKVSTPIRRLKCNENINVHRQITCQTSFKEKCPDQIDSCGPKSRASINAAREMKTKCFGHSEKGTGTSFGEYYGWLHERDHSGTWQQELGRRGVRARRSSTPREEIFEPKCVMKVTLQAFFQKWLWPSVARAWGRSRAVVSHWDGEATQIMFSNIIIFESNRIRKQEPCFRDNSKNATSNLIIPTCVVTLVRRGLGSLKRLRLFVATFWCISMFPSVSED